MKILDVLKEAPIRDIEHVGNFSKNSSFRHERDRNIITHPASIENIKKKFGKTKQNINLVFVNTPQGGRITEHGKVDIEEVRKYLGDEVASTVQKVHGSNDITVVMTNNSADQRFHMTPWIIAHRMMHAFARKGGLGFQKEYTKPADELLRYFSYITKLYGVIDHGDRDVRYETTYNTGRNFQLFMKNFFQEVGTFKSARDRKIRDWFEVFNELGAQYMITGNIKFKELPRCVKSGRRNYCAQGDVEYSEAESALDAIGYYYKSELQKMLDNYEGSIFIM